MRCYPPRYSLRGRQSAIEGGLCGRFQPYWPQPGEPSQILRGRGKEELILGAIRAAQPQASKSQDAFEMSKQHLYLFSSMTGCSKFGRPGKRASDVAGIFLNVTWNFSRQSIWATSRFEFADITISLARAVTTRAVSPDAGARRRIGAPELDQLFPAGQI